jgi:hypothetical protein
VILCPQPPQVLRLLVCATIPGYECHRIECISDEEYGNNWHLILIILFPNFAKESKMSFRNVNMLKVTQLLCARAKIQVRLVL